MANKFLGLDSINVLKQYIDEQLAAANINTRVITVQAYIYKKDGETPIAPIGGGFDPEAVVVIYPEGWHSLKNVLDGFEDMDAALSEGSIWMTVGVVEGTQSIEWSTPMKVSGQNGVSVRFAYSYDKNALEADRYVNPKGVTSDNRVEYVWTKAGDEDWKGPAIWAMYAKDARDLLWRWKVTHEDEIDENDKPIQPERPQAGVTGWMSNIATLTLSQEYPYLWMSYQIVPSGSEPTDANWTEPILFSHWGKDGAVPDYIMNIYKRGIDDDEFPETPGITAPTAPEFKEEQAPEYYLTDGWVAIPEDDDAIWWQSTLMVDGYKSEVTAVGPVKRYNAVDGNAKPGPYTKFLYAWSKTQTVPELDTTKLEDDGWRPKGWYEKPDYDLTEDWEDDIVSAMPEASLWIITGSVSSLDVNGHPVVAEWTTPVKISGPRGPISYDYRIEQRYMVGTADKPQYSSEEVEWYKTIPATSDLYPYIWAQQYLVYYTMKYSDTPNAKGEYDIVEDDTISPKIVKSYGQFKLSGTNGVDGNRKNSVVYIADETSEVSITSFNANNLYIYNGSGNITYTMALDPLTFINGYTGKIANIGTGTVIINAGTFAFMGSGISVEEITLAPQESVELVCYKTDDGNRFLVLGKELKPAE